MNTVQDDARTKATDYRHRAEHAECIGKVALAGHYLGIAEALEELADALDEAHGQPGMGKYHS